MNKPRRRWLLSVLLFLATLQTASAYYDPAPQRWINRDPIGEVGGTDLYTFVKNSSLNFIDALGMEESKPKPFPDGTVIEFPGLGSAEYEKGNGERTSFVLKPYERCPPYHKRCGKYLGETEEIDKKSGVCWKTCKYNLDKSNPIIQARQSNKKGAPEVFINTGIPQVQLQITTNAQGDLGLTFKTECEKECPGHVFCGDKNPDGTRLAPNGGGQIVLK